MNTVTTRKDIQRIRESVARAFDIYEWCYANMSKLPMREIENLVIRAKLELVDGNVAQAARELGISRKTIQRRMKEAGK